MLISLLLIGAGAWAVLVLSVFMMQERLLYLPNLPGRALVATPADLGLPYQDLRLVAADGVELHGWLVPAPGATFTVIFFHGNAGNISHRLDWLRILHETGFSVLLLEYRGYGQSGGRPSEEGTHRDAQAAWDWLRGEYGIPADRILLFGESLGAAVATRLATEVDAGGLILFSAFSSVPDIAAHHYRFLPVRLLGRVHYPTVEYLREVTLPVLIMHSPDDEIVPYSHAHRLLAAAGEHQLLVQTAGDHNSGFLRSEARIRAALEAFRARAGSDRAQSGR